MSSVTTYNGNQCVTTTTNPAMRIGGKWVVAEQPKNAGNLFGATGEWLNGSGAFASVDLLAKLTVAFGDKDCDLMKKMDVYRHGCAAVHFLPAAKSFWETVQKKEPRSLDRAVRLIQG